MNISYMRMLLRIVLLACISLAGTLTVSAADDAPLKEFNTTFNRPFPLVWKTIKQVLVDNGCLIEHEKFTENEAGFYKGKMTSVYCVLASGLDTTFDVLEKYSREVPYIRAGSWSSARVQYIFIVTEKEDHSVAVRLKAEMSGFEEYVTTKFHYFDSNGMLDQQMLDRVTAAVEAAKEEE